MCVSVGLSGSLAPFVNVYMRSAATLLSEPGRKEIDVRRAPYQPLQSLDFGDSSSLTSLHHHHLSSAQLMCEIIWEFSNFPYKSWVIASLTGVASLPCLLVRHVLPYDISILLLHAIFCNFVIVSYFLFCWYYDTGRKKKKITKKKNEMCTGRHKKCKTIALEQRNMFVEYENNCTTCMNRYELRATSYQLLPAHSIARRGVPERTTRYGYMVRK